MKMMFFTQFLTQNNPIITIKTSQNLITNNNKPGL